MSENREGIVAGLDRIALTACMAAGLFLSAHVTAQTTAAPVKIGFISEFSGPYAATSRELYDGFLAYQHIHGTDVGGRPIELILKDTTGPSPEIARREASELAINEHADIFTGFGLTPNALAVFPISTQAKIPTVLLNATAVGLTLKSPYVVRVSQTIPQETAPLAKWALTHGIKRLVMLVADYAPGIDAEASFTEAFTAGGGTIVKSTRLPLSTVDFAPYMQRAADAHPDALFAFMPNGDLGNGLVHAYADRRLAKEGIKLIAAGEIIAEKDLDGFGAGALGLVSTSNYSAFSTTPQNQEFLKAYAEVTHGPALPGYMAVAGFDGAALIYKALTTTSGSTDPTRLVAAMAGAQLDSPRGPISIDPVSRDITQTIYVREVRFINGHYVNANIETFPAVGVDGR